MEEVREETEAGPVREEPPVEDAEPPLVLERLRNLGLVAIVLVPLLAVTLAAPGMPRWLAVAITVTGLAALVVWRRRPGRR
jgi:hypothetical protein